MRLERGDRRLPHGAGGETSAEAAANGPGHVVQIRLLADQLRLGALRRDLEQRPALRLVLAVVAGNRIRVQREAWRGGAGRGVGLLAGPVAGEARPALILRIAEDVV